MKKKLLIINLFLFIMFGFNVKVDALCGDNNLNNWSVDVNIKFIDFDRYLINENTGEYLGETMKYSYILTLDNMRDDVILKATTASGRKLEGIYIPGHKVYGLVDYTPKDGAIYTINVYGSDKSACPNELLKTLTYEIEPFNFYYKTEECEEYPDAEICKMYKDTSDVTVDEFKEEIEEYMEEIGDKGDENWFDKTLNFLATYGIFILLPIIIIFVICIFKSHKPKTIGRKKK